MKQQYIKESFLQYKNLEEGGEFSGYASIFNVKDYAGDIILPNAFAESIANNSSIKLLWQHQQNEPLGYIREIKEDLKGLYIKGKFLLELQRAKEAYILIKNKAIEGLSIGYTIEDCFYDDDTRYIKKVSLMEISVVTLPAQRLAAIENLKKRNRPQDDLESRIEDSINLLQSMF